LASTCDIAAVNIATEAFVETTVVVVVEVREEVEIDVVNHAVFKSINDKAGASNALVVGTFDIFAQL
jgi:hypothetical protein